MSAEARLRDALRHVFNPYDWYDDDGEAYKMPSQVLDEVIEALKQGEWLITGGTVLGVESARPISGVFTDAQWRVKVAHG